MKHQKIALADYRFIYDTYLLNKMKISKETSMLTSKKCGGVIDVLSEDEPIKHPDITIASI